MPQIVVVHNHVKREVGWSIGVPARRRAPYIWLAKSSPSFRIQEVELVPREGFEPPTLCLEGGPELFVFKTRDLAPTLSACVGLLWRRAAFDRAYWI